MEHKLLNIKQVAEMLNCSEATVRNRMKKKTIPQPVKRSNQSEALSWRSADMEKFLGIQTKQLTIADELTIALQKYISREIQIQMNRIS